MTKPRGRPAKPTELKLMQGTDRPDRENPEEPIPENPVGSAPDWFNPEETEIWDQVASVGFWLKDADGPTLERFCTYVAIWRAARVETLKKDGTWQKSPNGFKQFSVAYLVMVNSEKHLDVLGSNLGLDPVSRSKIKTGNRPAANPWSKFKKD